MVVILYSFFIDLPDESSNVSLNLTHGKVLHLVTVMLGLEGTFGADSEVRGLLGAEGRELDSELGQMGSGDLLVELSFFHFCEQQR